MYERFANAVCCRYRSLDHLGRWKQYADIITYHIDITKTFLLNLPVFLVFPVEAVYICTRNEGFLARRLNVLPVYFPGSRLDSKSDR